MSDKTFEENFCKQNMKARLNTAADRGKWSIGRMDLQLIAAEFIGVSNRIETGQLEGWSATDPKSYPHGKDG
jgi:hypothetical protein